MKHILIFFSVAALLSVSTPAMGLKPVSYVDTRMGTDSKQELSRGNTYPGTGRPFGMHLWTPQTEPDRELWKYKWPSETICGFNLTHACSPWAFDYACISLFPQTGEKPVTGSGQRGASFKHENETARPDMYKVKFDNGITTEFSPTDRCCIFRFRFPDNGESAIIQLDLWGNPGEVKDAGGRLTGEVRHVKLRNHFLITFNRPYLEYREWEDGAERGAYVTFPPGSTVEVKVGTSYISEEQAELNLQREIGSRNFQAVAQESRKVWNGTLGRIRVSGGQHEDLHTFYTCLYRSSLNSRMFYETDAEGNPRYYCVSDDSIHDGFMYSDNGYWDTFRSLFPLHNIIYREQQGRHMQAIMDIRRNSGWFPSWYLPYENGGMTGNHAISLLADAWAKGIRTIDPVEVMDAYIDEVGKEYPRRLSNGRLQQWWELGYIAYPIRYSSTATMEYAYDDWCALTFAKETGNGDWIKKLEESSKWWHNVFDPETGFMRGRDEDGNWLPDFRPGAWGGPFEEGNSWQHSFGVWHDIPGLVEAYGGPERFSDKLDSLFTAPSTIDLGYYDDVWNEMLETFIAGMGQFNQGNQPCHHIPYLYDYCGKAWKTQQHVRTIMSRLYSCTPWGYPGDEDQGATSAWYVMSALGFYSVCPGSSEYAIGSPLFKKAVIKLENGRKFTIKAVNNSPENIYIESMTLDGEPHERYFLNHSSIMDGAVLKMKMCGNRPSFSDTSF